MIDNDFISRNVVVDGNNYMVFIYENGRVIIENEEDTVWDSEYDLEAYENEFIDAVSLDYIKQFVKYRMYE